ncbi:MAG: T9SS type A sorting domain-containing protein [Bacteroidota bacterium]|nr:T9SS type A sorting domain-containing protein [Bacteroidota bacterium]
MFYGYCIYGLKIIYINGLPPSKTNVVIYDMLGKKVSAAADTFTNGEALYSLSVCFLPKGLYILSIGNEKVKVIVE